MAKRARAAVEQRSVFVAGLSWDVDWHQLKGLAAESGECTNADIYERDDGKSKGCGVFIKKWDGQQKWGRELSVRLDEKKEAPPTGQESGGGTGFISDGQGGAA
eukprot:gene22381-62328_t